MKLPVFKSYGNYSSSNYGVNSLVFTDAEGNEFWYSYQTLVAFSGKGEFHCRQNDWGSTTGKHLNWIEPDKSKRIDEEAFNKAFNRAFASS